jgi:lysophospholipase L1-like esterase
MRTNCSNRSYFHIVYNQEVKAVTENEILLDSDRGHVIHRARLTGCVYDEEIIALLHNCKGFRKLVHSIGIEMNRKNHVEDDTIVQLQVWNKADPPESITRIEAQCLSTAKETIIPLEDVEWTEEDDRLSKFVFSFKESDAVAEVSVKLYLHDAYVVPEVSMEPVDFNSANYQQLIKQSLVQTGNNYRLKKAIEKARSGEDVTIAYIGGSITQGASANPIQEYCYAYQSYERFKQEFGMNNGNHIHYVKAGVGGTPSQLGVIRYERDICKNGTTEPDIVVVEFGVNDGDDETKGVSYESLVLKILAHQKKTAVILLFNVFVDDWNLQDRLQVIGEHYDLPIVSIKNAVVDQFRLTKAEGNVINKRQFFHDIYHPTNEGHRIIADALHYLWAQVDREEWSEEDIKIDKESVYGHAFSNIKLLDRKETSDVAVIEEGSFTEIDTDLQCVERDTDKELTPQFPHNWMHTKETGNYSFRMKITSRNLMLVFKDSDKPIFGTAEVYVDGEKLKTLDPHQVNWTHCHATLLYDHEKSEQHEIEIKMQEGEEDKQFTILGFGYTP